jgi:hypothetical protein
MAILLPAPGKRVTDENAKAKSDRHGMKYQTTINTKYQ